MFKQMAILKKKFTLENFVYLNLLRMTLPDRDFFVFSGQNSAPFPMNLCDFFPNLGKKSQSSLFVGGGGDFHSVNTHTS